MTGSCAVSIIVPFSGGVFAHRVKHGCHRTAQLGGRVMKERTSGSIEGHKCLANSMVVIIAFCLLAVAPYAIGQAGTTASITGTVTDQTGAAIRGATVTVTNAETGAARSGTSTESGSYTVTPLSPGKYVMKVEMASFETFEQQNIVLTIGQVAGIDVHMKVGNASQQITVTADAP